MILDVDTLSRQRLRQSAWTEASTIRQLAAAVVRTTSLQDEFVTRAKSGSGQPFFYCHGDYGTRGFYALKLADLLDQHTPVFLLHPYRDLGTGDPSAIETMARSYLPHVLAAQPAGTFRLGGFC